MSQAELWSLSAPASDLWGPSDRDIRHRVNAFGYFAVPGGVQLNTRIQGRLSAHLFSAAVQFRMTVSAGRVG
jgi:hypothetical protein